MTQLSSFSSEDQGLIISLPYRAGLYVSYADDEDGERDDEMEMRAMEACLKEIAKVHEGHALTQEVAAEILGRKEDWNVWSQGVFNIEPLCEQAVLVLKEKASESEVKDYIKMVLEITTAVAQAYGEFGEEEPEVGFFGKAMGRIFGNFGSSDDANHPMNVSAAEDGAISRISAALKANI